MKLLISIALLFALQSLALAQSTETMTREEYIRQLGGNQGVAGIVPNFDNRYSGIEGSPFLNEVFGKGTVYLKDGRVVEVDEINLDLYSNMVQVVPPRTNVPIVLNNDSFEKVLIKAGAPGEYDQEFYFREKQGKAKEGFYELVSEDLGLFVYHKKALRKANYTGGYSAQRTSDLFYSEPIVYYVKDGGKMRKLKSSPKAMKSYFDNLYNVKLVVPSEDMDLLKSSVGIRSIIARYKEKSTDK